MAPRLDFEAGILRAATLPRGPGVADAVGYRWSDDDWVETWKLGYGTVLFWPVLAPPGELHLIWRGATVQTSRWLLLSQAIADSLAPADTVTQTWGESVIEYAAAVGKSRRWAAVSDRAPGLTLRLFFSDRRGEWEEVAASGGAGGGVTVGEINDTTALVVWVDDTEVRWGVLSGREWDPRGTLQSERYSPLRPSLRKRPSGGFWLTWGTLTPDIRLAAFDKGTWGDPLAITASYPEPHGQHFSMETAMSRDEAEYPVIAWDTDSPITGGVIAVSYPTGDGGYSSGEVVPGSGSGVLPSVVRDANGDVWVSWWEEFRNTWWTHTYTRATATNVRLADRGRRRTIAWTLDEPAPDSWWTVLRARDDGPFEEAARVQAGEGLEVAWTDDSPPRGHSRYKVRRDCLDTRYQWESEEVSWPPGAAHRPVERRQPTLKPPARPLGQESELEVVDVSPGPVEIVLYDLMGRRVLDQRAEGTSAGRIRLSLEGASSPLASGVYFVRVRDASGAWTPAVRAVVLR